MRTILPSRRSVRTRGKQVFESALSRAKGERASRERVPQFEIEQDLQRFAARFCGQISEAMEGVSAHATPELHECALKRTLLYCSSALDIVSGPAPELSQLDMLVFVSLSQAVFARHWRPNVFGEAGEPTLHALRRLDEELWELARKLLEPDEEQTLRDLIHDYENTHPDQIHVEGVRFSAFSKIEVGARERKQASGLWKSVRTATRAADEALLLGERMMFLAPRIPYLLRLHARLSMLELTSDGTRKLKSLASGIDERLLDAGGLSPILGEVAALIDKANTLAQQTSGVARDARDLSTHAMPLVSSVERMLLGQHENRAHRAITGSQALVSKTQELLSECNRMSGGDPAEALSLATLRIERMLQKLLWQLACVGGLLLGLFLLGSYLLRTR